MEKEKRIEYRLDFVERGEKTIQQQFFDSVNDAYKFITDNKLYTFTLVKEELIAQRFDNIGEFYGAE